MAKSIGDGGTCHLFGRRYRGGNLDRGSILATLEKASGCCNTFVKRVRYCDTEIAGCLGTFGVVGRAAILPLLFEMFSSCRTEGVSRGALYDILRYLLACFMEAGTYRVGGGVTGFVGSLCSEMVSNGCRRCCRHFIVFLGSVHTGSEVPASGRFERTLVCEPLCGGGVYGCLLSMVRGSAGRRVSIDGLAVRRVLPRGRGTTM